jgi:bis(5'-nucleosyl)-tetraphosphatase (symmetrical)
MSLYAIGDIQGCYDQLRQLLDRIAFDPGKDTLWVVGDLVSRGPKSLETLRYLRALGDAVVTVLGNHDLNLLAVAAGVRKAHGSDAVEDVLHAADRDDLLDWLRTRKMMHADAQYAMVHAGLLPQWSIARALELAGEVETALRGEDHRELLARMYGNSPPRWDDSLTGYDRLRVIVNAMTRLRLCDVHGTMEFSHKTGLEGAPAGYMPWFDVPSRASVDTPIICGHWAALGLMLREDLLAIDTGCVWGRDLTALRLEDRRLYRCDCRARAGKVSEE